MRTARTAAGQRSVVREDDGGEDQQRRRASGVHTEGCAACSAPARGGAGRGDRRPAASRGGGPSGSGRKRKAPAQAGTDERRARTGTSQGDATTGDRYERGSSTSRGRCAGRSDAAAEFGRADGADLCVHKAVQEEGRQRKLHVAKRAQRGGRRTVRLVDYSTGKMETTEAEEGGHDERAGSERRLRPRDPSGTRSETAVRGPPP